MPSPRTFDRLVHYDDRSLDYPIRTLRAVADRPLRGYSYAYCQTDQGREGACAGHGATQEAAARPKPFFGDPVYSPPDIDVLNRYAYEVYRDAQKIDPWAHRPHEGTTVLAAMKIGHSRGFWTEYRWALGPGAERAARDVLQALAWNGPVIMGSAWYEQMWEPDKEGFLHAAGEEYGGHCYLLTRVKYFGDRFGGGRGNVRNWAVWTPNSWGGEGQGWLLFDDLVILLGNYGEAVTPVNRLVMG